ncbi:hypothetical protein EVAR_81192_1 [Eumeta japonica]|uniref:Uncharacterized protein n=1 Tax=Eumeta variegata TaxID=151549 RepID=A0A4C1ULH7_EUMVA|nr:hypothetical protein EVAR_81192_1 [Eumeta japonica]
MNRGAQHESRAQGPRVRPQITPDCSGRSRLFAALSAVSALSPIEPADCLPQGPSARHFVNIKRFIWHPRFGLEPCDLQTEWGRL